MKRELITAGMLSAMLALAACEHKGPAQRAGEKIDEAARTLQNGGEKPPADKARDAAQDLREGVEKAADDVKK